MEEDGARLNRGQLAHAHLLVRALAARPGSETQSQKQIRRRAGTVQETVIRVLASADGPLQAGEIHAAAQELAGEALCWNTVKDCLHKHARRPASPVERIGHGRYRHR
jgi:hypothetical protein